MARLYVNLNQVTLISAWTTSCNYSELLGAARSDRLNQQNLNVSESDFMAQLSTKVRVNRNPPNA